MLTLQYCDGFCHTLTWISHRCTCVLNPLPTPFPLSCPRAPALNALLHALNLHWSSILHMVIYMFQSYYLKSPHPHLLPHNPKVCSLHLCLCLCLSVSLLLPCIYGRHYRLSKFHIYVLISLSDLLHYVK